MLRKLVLHDADMLPRPMFKGEPIENTELAHIKEMCHRAIYAIKFIHDLTADFNRYEDELFAQMIVDDMIERGVYSVKETGNTDKNNQ